MKYRAKGTIDAVAWDGKNLSDIAEIAGLATHGGFRLAGGALYVEEGDADARKAKALDVGHFVLVEDGNLATMTAAAFEDTFEPARKPREKTAPA